LTAANGSDAAFSQSSNDRVRKREAKSTPAALLPNSDQTADPSSEVRSPCWYNDPRVSGETGPFGGSIEFPGQGERMIESRHVVLKCSLCTVQKAFVLNMSQVRRLSEGYGLQLHCSSCSSPQMWKAVEPISLADPETSQSIRAKSILLVDDDDLILKLLQKVLESWEATIEVSTNGKDALSKLASRNFDLMICDLQMPEMSGQELYQHIQDNALLPPQRIIFLTGDKRSQVKEFFDTTSCYYLYKPIQFMEFSSQVQAVLANEAGE
jgi:CheY-like chemotaxis protein